MKARIKILKERPFVSDYEIESKMNFEEILNRHQAQSTGGQKLAAKSKGLLYLTATVIIVSATVLTIYFTNNNTLSYNQLPPPVEQPDKSEETPIQKPKPDVADSATLNEREIPKEPITTKEEAPKTIVKSENATDKETVPNQKQKPIESGYKPAEPVSGYEHLYEYFHKAFQVSELPHLDSLDGTIDIQFTITANGTVEQITLQNSLRADLDKQAIQIIEHMPQWTPAQLNGKPIKSRLQIPLSFSPTKSPEK
ncbi:MAG: energy transducer TonB [Marinoscillum sp.]